MFEYFNLLVQMFCVLAEAPVRERKTSHDLATLQPYLSRWKPVNVSRHRRRHTATGVSGRRQQLFLTDLRSLFYSFSGSSQRKIIWLEKTMAALNTEIQNTLTRTHHLQQQQHR